MGTIANAKVTHYYNCYNGYFVGCLQIREGELKKRLHVFPKRQQLFRIFLQLFSILEETLCRETICINVLYRWLRL